MRTNSANRLHRATERKREVTGSYFDSSSKTLTANDIRMIANKCMPKLIEACKKGLLIDINSIIKEYWEIQLNRQTPEELLAHIRMYGEDQEECRFTKIDMEEALCKLTGHKHVNIK